MYYFSLLIGLKYKETAQARKAGCEFCYLIVPSSNRPPEKQILPLTFSGTYQVELTCMFPPDVGSKCPKVLKRLKEKWRRKAIKLGDRPTQYSNTPSCDKKTRFSERYLCKKIFTSSIQFLTWIYLLFQFRYFSPGIYEELLRTKRQWDPENKFNHCQSIGNNDENCCPTS